MTDQTSTGRIPGFWRYAAAWPDRIAAVDTAGTVLTFGQLEARVNRLSHAIAATTAPDDTIAIVARNQVDYLAFLLACSQTGRRFTPVNSHLTAPEVAFILRDSATRLLFVDRDTASDAIGAGHAAGIEPDGIVSLDSGCGVRTVDEMISAYPAQLPAQRIAGSPMLYTSGTSGRPKGVRRPLHTVPPELTLKYHAALLTRLGIVATEHVGNGVHLVTSPLYHTAPLHNAQLALHLGHLIVVMNRFDAETSLELIDHYAVTWTHVVPTMMKRWLDLDPRISRGFDLHTMRWLLHGAAPCPISVKQRILDWMGPIVYEYYAATEAGGTSIGPDEWLAHPGSVGRPWPGADVRILDETGADLPAGDVGQIYLRNIRPFRYHNDSVKTTAAHHDGYVTVGDVGYLDDDGYLFLLDRRTDLILSGGVNIYPAEIEAVLLAHPDVADAGVIGIPDPDLHQVVHAVVEPRPGIDRRSLPEALRRYCEENLGSQKRPRTIELGTPPRSPAGKLLRRELRESYLARTTTQVTTDAAQ